MRISFIFLVPREPKKKRSAVAPPPAVGGGAVAMRLLLAAQERQDVEEVGLQRGAGFGHASRLLLQVDHVEVLLRILRRRLHRQDTDLVEGQRVDLVYFCLDLPGVESEHGSDDADMLSVSFAGPLLDQVEQHFIPSVSSGQARPLLTFVSTG